MRSSSGGCDIHGRARPGPRSYPFGPTAYLTGQRDTPYPPNYTSSHRHHGGTDGKPFPATPGAYSYTATDAHHGTRGLEEHARHPYGR